MKSLDGGENPPRVLGLACDLANGESVDAAVRHLLDAWPVVDILVNNAGAFALGKIGEAPPDEAERMFAVNAVGPFRLLHALVPAMKARGDGHVVTIGSVADRHAYAENAAYAATKHGMRAIHEVMREELRGSGVRATLVSPGPVDTALWDPIRPEERAGFPARSQMLRSEDVAEAVLFALTRPRHVNVDELRLTRS
jgi:NADP-dependent 3-hydroxy acid dehydrogenase YdfG